MFPVRMNLVDIVIKQLNKTEVVVDRHFRETRHSDKYDATITVKGQANFGNSDYNFNRRVVTSTGDANETEGHLVFEVARLQREGVTLAKGDIVTEIAGIPMDLTLIELRYESPLNGKFLLLYADFVRREGSY